MLAYFLAIAVGLGSFVLFMAAFFFPEVYRKGDFIWSGVGFFYALVLWFCAGRFTGAILLGQSASVALIGWLGWQTLRLRRDVTPQGQQTSTEAIAQTGAKGWFKGKTTQSSPVALTDDDTPEPSDEEMAEPSHEAATEADREAAAETSLESKFEEQTTPDSLPAAAAEADPSESDLDETPTQAQERVSPNVANKAKGKFWQTGIFVQVGRLLRRKPKNTPSTTPPTSETSAADEFDFDEIEDGVETRESQDTIEAPALVEPPAPVEVPTQELDSQEPPTQELESDASETDNIASESESEPQPLKEEETHPSPAEAETEPKDEDSTPSEVSESVEGTSSPTSESEAKEGSGQSDRPEGST